MGAWPFGIIFVFAFAVLGSLLYGGWATFTGVLLVFGLVPVLDAAFGIRTENPEPEEESILQRRWLFDAWLWLWTAAQLGLIGYGLFEVTFGARTPVELVGMTISIGILTGGFGITIAHELIHRPNRRERALAEVLMLSVSYPHWLVEHVLGHHKHVATPNDPASARRGESLYAFLPRTLWGTLKSAWQLEGKRIKSLGIAPWSLANRRFRYSLIMAAIYAGLGLGLGAAAVLFFLAQGLIAAVLLEIINYVEHYGLARKETVPGKYERVRPAHSWNSPHRLTGYLLFNLPRHADHHYLAARPYPILRHMEDSPILPAGYATMVLLASVPPLWRRVMDPRVDAWNLNRGLAMDAAPADPASSSDRTAGITA